MISFITPIYNIISRRAWCEKSISSIVSQDHSSIIQIILINDGSTDGSNVFLKYLANKYSSSTRKFILLNSSHQGVTKSLNKGLNLSSGSIIFRLDSDDYARSDRVTFQLAYLESHPEVYLLASSVKIVRENTITSEVWNTLTTHESLTKYFSINNPFCHSSVCFRREILSAVGSYNESLPYSQDYDLWYRISKRYRIASINDPLTYYRIHKSSINSTKYSLQSYYSNIIKNNIIKDRSDTL